MTEISLIVTLNKQFNSTQLFTSNCSIKSIKIIGHGVKKMINSENAVSVFQEIVPKELVPKPMFVADCFYKVFQFHCSGPARYCSYVLKTSKPRKVLNSLQFPELMTSDETLLTSFINQETGP